MKALLITVLGSLLLSSAFSTVWASDDSFAIARDRSIAGKRIQGACAPFAWDLYNRLTLAGGEAHLVVYNWRTPDGNSGKHAIVVYRDKEGRYWGMDNLLASPLWLAGSTPTEWAAFFAPNCLVEVTIHRTNPALAGHWADRSRVTESVPAKPATLLAKN